MRNEGGGGGEGATHRNRTCWTRCRVRQVGSESGRTRWRYMYSGDVQSCQAVLARVAGFSHGRAPGRIRDARHTKVVGSAKNGMTTGGQREASRPGEVLPYLPVLRFSSCTSGRSGPMTHALDEKSVARSQTAFTDSEHDALGHPQPRRAREELPA